MKRTAAPAAIAILFLSSAAFGAEIGVSLKLFGGATWARYSDLPVYDIPPPPGLSKRLNDRVGPAAGVGYELVYPFSRSLASVSSIEYIQKGSFVESYNLDERTNSYSYRLEALSLTQLLKIKPFPDLFPYALAGFELSHVLSHSYTWVPYNYKIDLTDFTKKTDFGLVAGAGGELSAGLWTSFFEVRYHLGLVNLSRGTGMLGSIPTLKTRALTLLVGIRYKQAKKAS